MSKCLICLYMFLFYCSINLHATVIEICEECAINSIQMGIDTASPHDTLLIKANVYQVENISVDRPLTLLGENDAVLNSKNGDEILSILSDSVIIKGLTFTGVTTSYLKERAAIRIVKKKHFKIEGNTIINCFFAIYLEAAKNGEILDNTIKGNATTEAESGNGVHAWYCKNLSIRNNKINGHRDGIYFEFVDDSEVLDNESFGNTRYGLHFMFSNDDEYTGNVFKDNGVGVAVMFSSRIKMRNNDFSFNWGRASYGLLLKEINDAEIEENNFEQNTIGIFVEGSNRVKYTRNNFLRNGWAIKFSGGCSANEVSDNNFINNALDLIVNTKLASNRFHHNYWSNYAGYDLDHDNIGDIPHYPVKLFSYVIDQVPEAIVLMRSLFVDLINFSEKVSPVFTPKEVKDEFPLMNKIQ